MSAGPDQLVRSGEMAAALQAVPRPDDADASQVRLAKPPSYEDLVRCIAVLAELRPSTEEDRRFAVRVVRTLGRLT